MILKAFFATLGKLALLVACAAFLTAVALFVFGGFLSTYPITRVSPRDRRLRLFADAIAAGAPALMTALANRQETDAG